jgi:damage-control phosphatase, subfamily I
MKTYLDCYPCLMRQALSASRKAGAPEALQKEVLISAMEELQQLPSETTPAEMAYKIHCLVREKTAIEDPYKDAKEQATQEALSLYPELKKKIDAATDRLEMAVRVAIAGNIIDLGVSDSYDIHATLSRVLTQPFAINDLSLLRKALSESSAVLFLADNAGETVFDRVLIEELNIPVTYVVKAAPIINDATYEDAEAAGITQVAEVIDNGSQAPGTILEQCSESFIQRFEQADLILAKGQANYESLSENSAPIFFLLQVKCNVIARDLGINETDIVLKYRS